MLMVPWTFSGPAKRQNVTASTEKKREGGGLGVLFTACTVEQTVAGLDGVIDLISTRVIIDLPQAKANNGHVISAAQFSIWGGHLSK